MVLLLEPSGWMWELLALFINSRRCLVQTLWIHVLDGTEPGLPSSCPAFCLTWFIVSFRFLPSSSSLSHDKSSTSSSGYMGLFPLPGHLKPDLFPFSFIKLSFFFVHNRIWLSFTPNNLAVPLLVRDFSACSTIFSFKFAETFDLVLRLIGVKGSDDVWKLARKQTH